MSLCLCVLFHFSQTNFVLLYVVALFIPYETGRCAEKCAFLIDLSADLCIFVSGISAEKCITVQDSHAKKCVDVMKRIALQQLIEWKNREHRKPLVLNGARQVGKTWLLHEFARNY